MIDGGAGNDALYGGGGKDVFVHTVGAGRDTIYNYAREGGARDGGARDGGGREDDEGDAIRVIGVDELETDALKILSDEVKVLDLGNDTLTIVNSRGVLRIEDESGSELISFDPTGAVVYGERYLMIDNSYSNETVDAGNYSADLVTINASGYTRGSQEGGLYILGNPRNNVLMAGSGGFTLDGGTGSDTLIGDGDGRYADVYEYSVGSGNKTIVNYKATLEEGADVIALVGDAPDIDESNFREFGSNTTLTVGSNQIVLVNPQGSIEVVDENGTEIYTYRLPDGLELSADKKTLTVTSEYNESTLDASEYNNLIEVINARNYASELEVIGNGNNNLILGPNSGGTLDGGAGSDSLSGSDGVDVFRFGRSSGNDTVYNYDGTDEDTPDMIQITGVSTLSKDVVRQSGNNVEVAIGGSVLTIVNPRGEIKFVNEEDEELFVFDTSGTELSADKKYLTIGTNYNDTLVTAGNYSTMIATIDARAYGEALVLEGNSNSNWIYAGVGGSTMDGRGYNDYLYGNAGRDVFRYRLDEGNEYIYNFNATVEGAGDVLQLLGVSEISKSDFRDTANGQTVLHVGTKTITLVDPIGAISVYGANAFDDEYGDEPEPMLVYGHSLPAGVSYNFNKTKLTLSREADIDDEENRIIRVEEWSNNLRNVDASNYEYDVVSLIGDTKGNELRAGRAGAYLNGGVGYDKLYGSDGADTYAYVLGEGNDYIYNYDSTDEDAADVVMIIGNPGTITRSNFSESGNNTVLHLGGNKLTFVKPVGRITLVDEDGEEIGSYSSSLTSGVSYNTGKTELTVGRGAELEDNVFDMATLSNNVRNINGSAYEGELYLIGNEKANELRAGSGGSTLDGRAGSDKLYGGAGEDHFIISVGGGNNVIYNYDGDGGDVLQLVGGGNITRSNFQDSGDNIFLSLGNEKIMLSDPRGAIVVMDEDGEEIMTYGSGLASGVYYTNNKTKLVISAGAELDDEVIDVGNYVNNLRDVDASGYEEEIVLVGNDKVNELRAGSGGASLNGGRGNDKLYGGAGEDTFGYTAGEGNDYIYNYNGGEGDVVQLFGITEVTRSSFRDSNGNVVLRLRSGHVTFVDPVGPIVLVDENGNTLEASYAEELPSGVSYNSNRTKLTVNRSADLGNDNVLDMATLANNIRDIDGTYYEGELVLIGNDKSNELRAGSGGATLDGGKGNDKLYGGSGEDHFIVSVGSGADIIYDYDGDDGDVIDVIGLGSLSGSDFQDSGSNVLLKVGSEKVVLNNPTGTITVRYGEDADQVITYGGTMPRGVRYSSDKRTLTIDRGADIEDGTEFDMSTLSNNLQNIDGTNYEGSLILKGNESVNELRAGLGGASMDGGLGGDKIYGGAGADTYVYRPGEGSDQIYNFNGDEGDIIQMKGVTSLDEDAFRENGRNIVLTVGNNRLTLINPSGAIEVVDENGDELATYNNRLPEGVSYNSSRTKLTVGRNADLGDENLLDMATLSNNLRDIDASDYEGEIMMNGNNRQNELRAGSGGSSMNGGRGNDKIYCGEGSDTIAYLTGEGNDYIYNYDGSSGDVLQLLGNVTVDEEAFRDNGTNVVLTVGANRLTLIDPVGQIVVVDADGTTIATHNEALPEGVRYNRTKTKLIIGTEALLEEVEVRVSDYAESVRDIDASAYSEEIELIGDEKANELYAGSGGATLEGGLGNDNLYGGTGADMYRYSEGDGNDYIYNYDTTGEAVDVVQLRGVTDVDWSSFRDSGRNTILTVGTQRLTFVNPKGQIILVDENDEELMRYGATLTSGVSYNNSKTKLTVGRGAELDDEVFDMSTLSSNVKDIDGTNYEGELVLLGNSKANELRAGSGGSTLNGGMGNDKLYGGAGTDVFEYVAGEGNDKIYNYGAGDVIRLVGVSGVDRTNFKESGKNTILTVGNNRLTIMNSSGNAIEVQVDGDEETYVYGRNVPDGVSYNSGKTKLTVGRNADLTDVDGEIRVEEYVNALADVNASGYVEEIAIYGDDKANELRAGSGGSTLSGGGGNDVLYGGAGADVYVYTSGSDDVYNYDPENDRVSISGGMITSARISGSDIVYSIGTGSLTLKNAAMYGMMAIRFAEEDTEQLRSEYWFELEEGISDPLTEIMCVEKEVTEMKAIETDELKSLMSTTLNNAVRRREKM